MKIFPALIYTDYNGSVQPKWYFTEKQPFSCFIVACETGDPLMQKPIIRSPCNNVALSASATSMVTTTLTQFFTLASLSIRQVDKAIYSYLT